MADQGPRSNAAGLAVRAHLPEGLVTVTGHEVSPATDWSPRREESRWVGKPWRRIEILTCRDFWKGEEVGRSRDLTIHVGLRRLGLGFTLILMKADVLDYSDEPNQ